jgi:hypothetical protein
MAVVSVKEQHQRRRSSYRDGRAAHTRVFLVITDDITDGTAVAINATDGTTTVPGPADSYGGVAFSGKDAQPVQDSGNHFEVTVEFSERDPDDQQNDVHPLDRPWEVSWSSNDSTAPYFMDKSPVPKPVVNTAGDAFDQFLERETGSMVITVTRNEEYHDAAEADTYSHTSNAEGITIDGTFYPTGTLKLSPIHASKHVEKVTINGFEEFVTYYRKTYTFKAQREGWKDRPLDVGTNEIKEVIESISGTPTLVKKLRPITDSQGLIVKKPWPLDGTGKKKLNPTDPAEELEFTPFTEKSWAALLFI